MKTLITSHRSLLIIVRSRSASILTALALGAFGLSPKVQAVSPPPDGGYAGGNTAEGQNALLSLTTGGFNTAVGFLSLRSDTTGQFNTAIGAGTLFANTGDENTATGAGALLSNTTGAGNTANGVFALFSNTTGFSNTAIGEAALFFNTVGSGNTATGLNALQNNAGGTSNTADGVAALLSNTSGAANAAMGQDALSSNTAGSNNTAIGNGAGSNQTTGSNNVYIGAGAVGFAGENSACYIASIFSQTSPSGIPVLINANGKLGTTTSSKRFKDEIKPMDKASEAIFALKPVTFRYKKDLDPEGTPQFGLVAEEVQNINPALVVRDREGKPYTVRYDQVNAMLLNEFLKEHKKVEKQEATITRLTNDFQTVSTQQRNEIQLLSAQLKEQAAQIQKVSAQLETSQPASQVVNNR